MSHAGTSEPARIEVYLGQSGSGKGLSINRRLADLAPARLVIWDPQAEYGAHAPEVSTVAAVGRVLAAAGKAGPVRVRLVPDGSKPLPELFGLLCRLVYASGSLVFVAEELPDVTTPSWAPPAWRVICTQGRHRRLHVIAAAQRPALIDKTVLGNSTLVRCGSLAEAPDRRAMATALDVSPADVDALICEELPPSVGGARTLMLERSRRGLMCDLVRVDVSKTGIVSEKRHPFPTLRKRGILDTAPQISFDLFTTTPAAAGNPQSLRVQRKPQRLKP